MSKHLERFFEEWSRKVRSGKVSSLDRLEVAILELYDQWLTERKIIK
jgi:hypothetical protein